MNSRILLFLLTLLSSVVYSQYDSTKMKFWGEDPIKVGDFRMPVPEEHEHPSRLHFGVVVDHAQKEFNDTLFSYPELVVWMNRDRSYMAMTDSYKQLLKYNQLLFNMLEVNRRRLQEGLFYINGSDNYGAYETVALDSLKKRMQRIREEAAKGNDAEAINRLLEESEEKLTSIEKPNFPSLSQKFRGVNIYLAPAVTMFGGEAANTFGSGYGFGYGAGFLLGNFNLRYDGQFAGISAKRAFTENGTHWPNDFLEMGTFALQGGYSFYNNSRFTLTPGIGGSLLWFAHTDGDSLQMPIHRFLPAPSVSVALDYKFWREMSFVSKHRNPGARRYEENQVRLLVQFVPMLSGAPFRGSVINVGIGWSWIQKRYRIDGE